MSTRPHHTYRRGGRGGSEPRLRIREREARVQELHNRGRTQREIATEIGLSQPAVCKIIRRIEERLLNEMHRERIRHLARMQMRTEHVYREAQQGWERSCAERQRRRQRRTTGTGSVPTEREVIEVCSETQAGDPRFLREQLRAMAELRATFNLGGLDWNRVAELLERDGEATTGGSGTEEA